MNLLSYFLLLMHHLVLNLLYLSNYQMWLRFLMIFKKMLQKLNFLNFQIMMVNLDPQMLLVFPFPYLLLLLIKEELVMNLLLKLGKVTKLSFLSLLYIYSNLAFLFLFFPFF